MKVLFVHPEDPLPTRNPRALWDLVIDIGRAPVSSYESTSRELGCSVLSLYQFADGAKYIERLQQLLQLGKRSLRDREGHDWWDLLSVLIVSELRQFILLDHLRKQLRHDAEIFCTRSDFRTAALQSLFASPVRCIRSRPVLDQLSHYRGAWKTLDSRQLRQIFLDKFDSHHRLRRRFARSANPVKRPVVLLPSAYSNVSRTLVGYAELMPETDFLLVLARGSARLNMLPNNVHASSLDSYFSSPNRDEVEALGSAWLGLESQLAGAAAEFRMAREAGVLRKIASSIPWGLAMRDAWSRLFTSHEITACFSADNNNPYTRIPLRHAKNLGLLTIDCHHGALDYTVRMRGQEADFYLAKSDMERDYLENFCRLQEAKILPGTRAASKRTYSSHKTGSGAWLTFFTEPYRIDGWRSDHICRELLPVLASLAERCKLKLVLKIHPFESVKDYRRMLRKYLSQALSRSVQILAGPPTAQLWDETRFAVTVESSTAVECQSRGIPVFLLGWLREAYLGYMEQYVRFGVGQVVDSALDLMKVPELLEAYQGESGSAGSFDASMLARTLSALFSGRSSLLSDSETAVSFVQYQA